MSTESDSLYGRYRHFADTNFPPIISGPADLKWKFPSYDKPPSGLFPEFYGIKQQDYYQTFKTSKQRLMNMEHYKTLFKYQQPVRALCILVFFLVIISAKSSYSRDK